jgi:hypothetical protein
MRITVDMIMGCRPCIDYPRGRVERLWAGRGALSPGDMRDLPIPGRDLTWAWLSLLARGGRREAVLELAKSFADLARDYKLHNWTSVPADEARAARAAEASARAAEASARAAARAVDLEDLITAACRSAACAVATVSVVRSVREYRVNRVGIEVPCEGEWEGGYRGIIDLIQAKIDGKG